MIGLCLLWLLANVLERKYEGERSGLVRWRPLEGADSLDQADWLRNQP